MKFWFMNIDIDEISDLMFFFMFYFHRIAQKKVFQ